MEKGLGRLARWTLSAGQTHGVTQAEGILDGVATQAVVAGKAYDAASLIDIITQTGASAVIPPRENRQEPRAFDTHQ